MRLLLAASGHRLDHGEQAEFDHLAAPLFIEVGRDEIHGLQRVCPGLQVICKRRPDARVEVVQFALLLPSPGLS